MEFFRVFGLNRRGDWSKLSPEGVVLGRPGCRRPPLVTACSLHGELISSPLLGAERLVGPKHADRRDRDRTPPSATSAALDS